MKTLITAIVIYRSMTGHSRKNREGAFSIYADTEVELVGYTTCNGCFGGNIEYAGDEMVKNGGEVIHLATGLVVGYPQLCFFDFGES